MSRRSEDDYTAWEQQARWGGMDGHEPIEPAPRPVDGLVCAACCVLPTDVCICAGWSQVDEVDYRRRMNRRSYDYRQGAA